MPTEKAVAVIRWLSSQVSPGTICSRTIAMRVNGGIDIRPRANADPYGGSAKKAGSAMSVLMTRAPKAGSHVFGSNANTITKGKPICGFIRAYDVSILGTEASLGPALANWCWPAIQCLPIFWAAQAR